MALFPDPEASPKVNLLGIFPDLTFSTSCLMLVYPPPFPFTPLITLLKCPVSAEFSESQMHHTVHFSECKKKQTIPIPNAVISLLLRLFLHLLFVPWKHLMEAEGW